jgi:phage host-nuclease inhibitor protein Gam
MTTRAQAEAQENWQTILDLSNTMLACAQSRDWETMSSLMDARDKLMKLYFSVAEEEERIAQNAGANNAADIAALSARIALSKENIEVIKEIDQNILNYTEDNKDQLSEELGKLRNARKMVKGYHDK